MLKAAGFIYYVLEKGPHVWMHGFACAVYRETSSVDLKSHWHI